MTIEELQKQYPDKEIIEIGKIFLLRDTNPERRNDDYGNTYFALRPLSASDLEEQPSDTTSDTKEKPEHKISENEPKLWGIIIADMLKHLSIMYDRMAGFSRNRTINHVLQFINAEVKSTNADSVPVEGKIVPAKKSPKK